MEQEISVGTLGSLQIEWLVEVIGSLILEREKNHRVVWLVGAIQVQYRCSVPWVD